MRDKRLCTGYENQGICAMCGGKIESRRRQYCSDECANLYRQLFLWPTASRHAIKMANGRCQQCGITDKGICKSRHLRWGVRRLEVHHIVPLNGEERAWHRLNYPSNLLVLCHECHVLLHRCPNLRTSEGAQ